MKSFFTLLSLVAIMGLAMNASAQSKNRPFCLMPYPQHISAAKGRLELDSAFTVSLQGPASGRLQHYARRFLRRLAQRTGLELTRHAPAAGPGRSGGLLIRWKRAGRLLPGEDESYRLNIRPSGAVLQAETDIGAMRGLETLLQLLQADSSGYFFPAVKIQDAPRFTWRGLLIDVSRHFIPLDVLKRNLDGMAAVKLNVLHLHLTDDQGFRIESRVFPRLHKLGSDGLFFTQAQMRELIRYAAARGIRIVPEFDMPGHTTSWLVGYPELGSAPGPYELIRTWGIQYPVLNVADERVYEFLDQFFGEMAELFPDPYFHIGGDEVEHAGGHLAEHWNSNPEIQRFKKEHGIRTNQELQAYFNRRIYTILQKRGKIMVGWDEILAPDMPRDVVIQSWRGPESMVQAARMGYRSILSSGYYLDLNFPAAQHYLNDPLAGHGELNSEEKDRVLGGEACMWSEFVDAGNIDSRIWPRLAAVAERLWSPQEVNSVPDMYRRLEVISQQLEEHGLTHLSGYGVMLRRLAGYGDTGPLKVLVDVVEPVKGYRRNYLRPQTQFTPLSRVVDAARPDAPAARHFREAVDRFLQGEPGQHEAARSRLESWLLLWRANHERLVPVIRQSPVLREIESLSADLSNVAAFGLEALQRIEGGEKASKAWLDSCRAALEKAAEPRGQVELVILPVVRKLCEKAVE